MSDEVERLPVEARSEGVIAHLHYFAHATVGPFGLVNVLARKAGIVPRRSRAETALAVSQVLLEDKRNHLLVLDEVHVMPDNALEDVRLLSIADFREPSTFDKRDGSLALPSPWPPLSTITAAPSSPAFSPGSRRWTTSRFERSSVLQSSMRGYRCSSMCTHRCSPTYA